MKNRIVALITGLLLANSAMGSYLTDDRVYNSGASERAREAERARELQERIRNLESSSKAAFLKKNYPTPTLVTMNRSAWSHYLMAYAEKNGINDKMLRYSFLYPSYQGLHSLTVEQRHTDNEHIVTVDMEFELGTFLRFSDDYRTPHIQALVTLAQDSGVKDAFIRHPLSTVDTTMHFEFDLNTPTGFALLRQFLKQYIVDAFNFETELRSYMGLDFQKYFLEQVAEDEEFRCSKAFAFLHCYQAMHLNRPQPIR